MVDLSPVTVGVLAVVAASITAIAVQVLLAVVGSLGAALRRRPAAAAAPPARRAAAAAPPRSRPKPQARAQAAVPPPPQKAQPRQPGVGLKALLKGAAKAKAAAGAGPDPHESHEAFLGALRLPAGAAATGVAFSADGAALAAGCDDGAVRLWALAPPGGGGLDFSGKPKAHAFVRKSLAPRGVAFAGAGRVAALTAGIADAAGLAVLDFSAAPAAAGKGGSGGSGGAEVVWEADEIFPASAAGTSLEASARSPAGPPVLVAVAATPHLAAFLATGARLGAVETGGMVQYGAAVSADGRLVASASFAADVRVYEAAFDRAGAPAGVAKAAQLGGHRGRVTAAAFSPDGRRAATASADGSLRLWTLDVRYREREDPRTLLAAGQALPPGESYSLLRWGPTHVAAVAGSTVHLLDPATLEVAAALREPHGARRVADAAWAPGERELAGRGRRAVLATCGGDGRIRLWAAPAK